MDTKDKRMTIELSEGYNGHTCRFYAEPIDQDATCVKLAVVGKDYLFAWRDKAEVAKAVTSEEKRIARQARANVNRRERNQAMRDIGLVRVRGALGGVYWE